MGLKKLIKRSDMFGHQIQLKFKGQDTHKTILGGLLSIVVRVALLLFLITRVQLLFDDHSLRLTSRTDKIDFEQLGKINAQDHKVMPVLTFKK